MRAIINKKAPDWGRGSQDCIYPTRRSLFLLCVMCYGAEAQAQKGRVKMEELWRSMLDIKTLSHAGNYKRNRKTEWSKSPYCPISPNFAGRHPVVPKIADDAGFPSRPWALTRPFDVSLGRPVDNGLPHAVTPRQGMPCPCLLATVYNTPSPLQFGCVVSRKPPANTCAVSKCTCLARSTLHPIYPVFVGRPPR